MSKSRANASPFSGTRVSGSLNTAGLNILKDNPRVSERVEGSSLEYRPICLKCGKKVNASTQKVGRVVRVPAGTEVPLLGGGTIRLTEDVEHGVCEPCWPSIGVKEEAVSVARMLKR